MKTHLATAAAALTAAMLSSCTATGDERSYDTTRVNPVTPVQTVPPDSTTGVARSSGRPGVAGDTVSRSSNISAPTPKTPDSKRP
jgi:hypothetical protein